MCRRLNPVPTSDPRGTLERLSGKGRSASKNVVQSHVEEKEISLVSHRRGDAVCDAHNGGLYLLLHNHAGPV